MLSLPECLLILEHIDGLIVVDEEAKIIYMNEKTARSLPGKVNPKEIVGKHIKDIIPTTKIHHTVKNKKPAIADPYILENITLISTRYPIYQDDKFFGVVEYDVFDSKELLKNFLKKINSLYNELDFFKTELKRLQSSRYSMNNIVGESSSIKKLREEIRQAANTNSTVLISGETGCGKELVAHAIHDLSNRRLGNFVRLNCAAIPSELFESELFGYEGGSFTNAKKEGKTGKFQLADNGTLFLDEINQMPYALQPKILRALQEKEIDKIGGNQTLPIDIRVISAANEDLKTLIQERRFREDLFYRLNVIHIRVPSLRERKQDIPLIAESHIHYLNGFLNRNVEVISHEVLELLMSYQWPGNIRELQNVLERAMNRIDLEQTKLKLEHFDFLIDESGDKTNVADFKTENPIEEAKRRAERELIMHAISLSNGNKTKAADFLNIPRALLYQKMKRLNIKNE